MPRITVLMSIHNAEQFVERAVGSVLNQSMGDFELLIIDDASTDRSMEIVRSLADERVRIVTNKQNLGLTVSLNLGLAASGSEYIARLDADDVAKTDRLQKQMEYMDSHPSTILVSSWRELIDEKGDVINTDAQKYTAEDMFYLLHLRNVIIHSSTMLRRLPVIAAGGYDESFKKGQDFELWNRLSKLGRIEQLPEYLVQIRQHAGSISSKSFGVQQDSVRRVVRREVRNLLGKELDNDMIDMIRSYVVDSGDPLLHRARLLLEELNSSVLKREASIISALKLAEDKISLAMDRELGRYNQ